MDLHLFTWPTQSVAAKNIKSTTMLVFLHGMGGTGYIWRPIAANLEDEFLCVAPDQRGHGNSRLVPTSEANLFHASDYARDIMHSITTLVHEHSPRKLYIIGHSMGVRSGLATADLILNSDNNIRAIFKGFISIDIGLQSKWGGGIGEPLANFIRELPETFPDRLSMRDHLFAHCPDPSIAQYLSAVAKKTNEAPETWAFPFDHEALVQTILQANDAPIELWVNQIANADIPFLALRGEQSKVWLKEDYERSLITLIHPKIIFEEWENCGHGLPFEQRVRFVNKVREFCK